jgi:enoyl-CoA hydratase
VEAIETATTFAVNAPLFVDQARKPIHHGLQIDLKRGLMFEIEAYNRRGACSPATKKRNLF